MKVIVKQKNWSYFKTHYEEEKIHEYDDGILNEKNKIYVDYYEDKNSKGKIERTTYFAFSILKRTNDCLKIKVWGLGAEFVEPRKQCNPFVLKVGESQAFSTNSKDSGKNFEISLVE